VTSSRECSQCPGGGKMRLTWLVS